MNKEIKFIKNNEFEKQNLTKLIKEHLESNLDPDEKNIFPYDSVERDLLKIYEEKKYSEEELSRLIEAKQAAWEINYLARQKLPKELIDKARQRALKKADSIGGVDAQKMAELEQVEIQAVIESRYKKGYETKLGFHVGPNKINEKFLNPDSFVAANLEKLYAEKSARWLHVVDIPVESKIIDVDLEWYQSNARIPILRKYSFTPELAHELNAKFAKINELN